VDGLHTVNVWVHVACGAAALAVGLIPLLAPKGGRVHRRFGRWFVRVAAAVLLTAVIGDVLFAPPAALIAATLAAGYQYLSSLRALALRDRGPGFADAALALAGLGACLALYLRTGPGTPEWTPAIGYSTIFYVAFVAAYDISRHFWRRAWLVHVRPLDHGLKMTGAWFAMLSAGAGNIFREFQPWSQVGPSMLGLAAMLVLALAYLGGRPARAAAAG